MNPNPTLATTSLKIPSTHPYPSTQLDDEEEVGEEGGGRMYIMYMYDGGGGS
jgi:hypothetical protein